MLAMNTAPPEELKPSRLADLLRPIHAFLEAESTGGIVLMVVTLIALAWANSPWGDSYAALWHVKLSITLGSRTHAMSLAHWVNDGLMVVFFLLVGLEIKRELLIGELATLKRATLPIAAAVGGMLMPAMIYGVFNARGSGSHGWGVPMATDIAFAMGVLTLVGRSVPVSVKMFLLAIAIVDDLGAVIVIAVFYTNQINGMWLAIGGGCLAGLIGLNVLRVHRPSPYILLGVALWVATLYSGIHATIAGVLLAFTIPATRQIEELPYIRHIRKMLAVFEEETAVNPNKITEKQSYALKSMEVASQGVQMPLARIEHALLRPVNFLIIPLFALANAGIDLRGGLASQMGSPITHGVLLGLLVGKPMGILLASWLAIKLGLAALPTGSTRRHIVGVSMLCGIGFTMSLFVGNLAFEGRLAELAATKVGILAGSVVSGILGGAIISRSGKAGA